VEIAWRFEKRMPAAVSVPIARAESCFVGCSPRRASATRSALHWDDGDHRAMTDTFLREDDDLYRLPFDKVLSLLQLSTVLYYLH
jgi:hypothetical protein